VPASRDEIAGRIEAAVRQLGQVQGDDGEFGRDVHLFDSGYLDSLGSFRLIEFIEETYDFSLSEDELLSPDFVNINGITDIIWARRPED
jgi:methoxymalonate biosynthesis acyl carrier protein